MKANYQMSELPQSGVQVTIEGALMRLLFDFTPAERHEDESEETDTYNCESVDVHGRTSGDIIAAIVNDRYSSDSVQAIMANYAEAQDSESEISDEKRAEHIEEYEEYQTWRKHAKEIASTVVSLI